MAISTEQFMGFVRRNPVGVACGALSIVIAATLYLRVDKIDTAQAELDQMTALSERLMANVQNSAQLKDQLDALSADNKLIEARLVRTQVGANNGYFYGIESDTGAKIITPINQSSPAVDAKSVKSGDYVPVGFAFTVQGTFPQILDFLHRLENGQSFCRIQSASVMRTAGEGANLLNLSLSLDLLGQQP